MTETDLQIIERARVLVEQLELRIQAPPQEWYSIKETAIMTGLSSDLVRDAVLGGNLPTSNMGSPDRPLYRISRSAIYTWMKDREAGPKPARRRRLQDKLPLPASRHFRTKKQAAVS